MCKQWPDRFQHRIATALFFFSAFATANQAVAQVFPAELPIESLYVVNGGDGRDGTVFSGLTASDRLGYSTSGIGDINNDGLDDFVLGATGADGGGVVDAGQSYVMFGTRDALPAEFSVGDLLQANGGDGSRGFVLNGVTVSDRSGTSVSAAGDVNGDDIADLVITASRANPNGADSGQAYVVYGRAGGFPAEMALSALLPANGGDGTTGVVLNGVGGNDGSTGLNNARTAGDVNDDGIDDLVLCEWSADRVGQNSGECYVVFGVDGGLPVSTDLADLLVANGGDGSTGTVFFAEAAFDALGTGAATAGDVNADGIDDLIMGAGQQQLDGAGRAYVVFGRDTGFPAELELSALRSINGGDGSAGFVLQGRTDGASFGRFGEDVAGAGDLNNDGVDDIFIGAMGVQDFQEKSNVFVVFGSAAGFLAELDVEDLLPGNGGDGSTGFVINPFSNSGGHMGSFNTLAASGDVNGDGIDDLLIGEPLGSYAAIVYGRSGPFAAEFDLRSLLLEDGGDGTFGVALETDLPDSCCNETGRGVSAVGDVNGDGVSDLLIPAPRAQSSAGAAHLLLGRADNDADGVLDRADNCQMAANADQRDSNGDGYGNVCDADLSNDCITNVVDLGLLRTEFFSSGPDADLDGDGVVNVVDLGLMRTMFFLPPGPSGVSTTCAGP